MVSNMLTLQVSASKEAQRGQGQVFQNALKPFGMDCKEILLNDGEIERFMNAAKLIPKTSGRPNAFI